MAQRQHTPGTSRGLCFHTPGSLQAKSGTTLPLCGAFVGKTLPDAEPVPMDRDAFSHLLADNINPIFLAMLAAAPAVGEREPRPWRWWGRCTLAVAVPVALAEVAKARSFWAGHPGFPSGHETFGLACATCLASRFPRSLLLTGPLCLLLAWALVNAHYHDPVDAAGALLLGPPVAWLCLRLARRPGVDNTGGDLV